MAAWHPTTYRVLIRFLVWQLPSGECGPERWLSSTQLPENNAAAVPLPMVFILPSVINESCPTTKNQPTFPLFTIVMLPFCRLSTKPPPMRLTGPCFLIFFLSVSRVRAITVYLANVICAHWPFFSQKPAQTFALSPFNLLSFFLSLFFKYKLKGL